ncbi:MAG: hypothetical protein KC466_16795 [Myxococcales bacterium]|nr:hypothetical protein [Myxococcales bacterium]
MKFARARVLVASLMTVAAGAPLSMANAGPLLDKALAYSADFQANHSPAFGCRVEIRYDADFGGEILVYEDLGDSSIWTGNYVAGESYRYAVTGDPEAKAFAKRGIECLLALEEVTGKPGFLARWVGPWEGAFRADQPNCEAATDCHVVTEGPYAGDFWLGNTSSDQYLGWWYGLSHAMSLLLEAPEDEPLRARIRGAIGRVIDTLRAEHYLITDPDGTVSTAGPEIVGNEAIAMHLVAADVVGGAYADLLPQVYAEQLLVYPFSASAPISRWYQYFGLHLGHMADHMILRHEKFRPFMKLHRDVHRRGLYRVIENTQQAMFDYIAWGTGSAGFTQAQLDADKVSLAASPMPPRFGVSPAQGPWVLDPVVEALNELGPIIAGLLGEEWRPLGPQARDPFPPDERCVGGFRWQQSPYGLCGGGDRRKAYPGEDYIVAYWMGRYHGFVDATD